MRELRALALLLTLASLAACGGSDAPPQADDGRPDELVLGLVPSREANVLIDNLGPLREFLSQEIGIPVETFVPQDYTGLVEAMGAGRADIGMIPPFAAMLGKQRYDLETLLISVRGGEPTYRSQWMTNDPSLCQEPPAPNHEGMLECFAPIEVVAGRQLAFTDPTSTTGYLFPALQLMEAGIDPDTDIQSVFLGSHDASVFGLYNGDVEISVSFDDARRLVREEIPDVAEKIIVFNHSADIPNDGVTVRGDLPEDVKAAIGDAFLAFAARDAELPLEERVLWAIYEIDGFVEFEPGTYDMIELAFEKLRDKIQP